MYARHQTGPLDVPNQLRRRAVVLSVLTVVLSGTALGGIQLVGASTTARATPALRYAVVAPKPVRRWFVRRATARRAIRRTTRPTTPAVPAASVLPAPVAPDPNTCAGVVAGIAWPPGWRVHCAGPREGLLGVTEPAGLTDLFVRAGESMYTLRIVALHEAGHAWNRARLDPARIARWCAARGCDARHFFAGAASGEGWAEPLGAEDWATAWDACHGGSYHRSYLGLGAPTPSQCALQDRLVASPR